MNIPIDPISQFKKDNTATFYFINEIWNKKYYISLFVLASLLFFFSLKYLFIEKNYIARSEIHPNPKVSYVNKNPLNIAMSLEAELREYIVGYETGPDGVPTVSFFNPDEIIDEFAILLKDENNILSSAREFLDKTEIVDEADKQKFIDSSISNFNFYIDLFSGVSKYSNYIVVEFVASTNELAKAFLAFHVKKSLINFDTQIIEERDYRIDLAISRIESDVINRNREISDQKTIFTNQVMSSLRRLERDIIIAEDLNIIEPSSKSPQFGFIDPLYKESSYWKGKKVLENEILYLESELESDSKSILMLKLELEELINNINLLKDFKSSLNNTAITNEVFYVSWSEKSVTSKMDFISDKKLLVISLIFGFLIGFIFSVMSILRINRS